MITAFLLGVGASIAVWVASLFPVLDLHAITGVVDQIYSIFAMGAGLGVWVDWAFVGVVASIPLAVWVAGMSVKGVRVLISHLPWIGGRG